MNLLLVTIPHTGTRFFIDLLEPVLGPHTAMREKSEAHPLQAHNFATCHVEYGALIDEYIALFNPVLVTTTRQMAAVRSSYVKRGRNDERIWQHFKSWLEFMDKYGPLVVSVDAQDRDERLRDLSRLIGHDLQTEWKRKGSYLAA